jgi:hypothetical protein
MNRGKIVCPAVEILPAQWAFSDELDSLLERHLAAGCQPRAMAQTLESRRAELEQVAHARRHDQKESP